MIRITSTHIEVHTPDKTYTYDKTSVGDYYIAAMIYLDWIASSLDRIASRNS